MTCSSLTVWLQLEYTCLGSSSFNATSIASLREWPYHQHLVVYVCFCLFHVSLNRVSPPRCYHQLGVLLGPILTSRRYCHVLDRSLRLMTPHSLIKLNPILRLPWSRLSLLYVVHVRPGIIPIICLLIDLGQ
jgi:hypothetical protein